ncbi:MAG: stage II sporulation protein R [Blautia sp.]|uniref:stage II sporulation protein R n=1 Tax=Blautia sp. TaxID=1955243 RepID=UPI002E75E5A5|nr:stage II sporulation protein R [Blautia sp.]MEE1442150.1 stage II sporulation protein R [Blautia sp.]
MKEILQRLQNKKILLAAVLIGLAGTLFFTGLNTVRLKRENREIKARLDREIQQGIAREVFRLHVIANSDTEKDQELKLKVKTRIVEYLKEILGEDAGLDATKEGVLTHLTEIEQEAEKLIQEQGFDYSVKAVVEKTYFPEKTYGDCTFPAGEYEALNVKIGKAKGKNWWCVLYPSLCFLDDTYGIVEEEKKEDLKEVLTTEEFQEILGGSREKKKLRFGFRWF